MRVWIFFLRHRIILYSTVLNGIKMRTTGNVLGAFWLILYPMLFLAMYYAVFSHILNVRIPGLSTPEYIALIFSGLVPFLAFSEAFSTGTVSVIANKNLLKNTVFPIELVTAKDVIISHMCVGMGLLLVISAVICIDGFKLTILIIPLVYIAQILFCIGLTWITSSLTVFFKDIQQAIPIFILFLMMVSPIAYTPEMVPENMRSLLIFNPIAHFMSLYRALLFGGSVDYYQLLTVLTMSYVVSELGFFVITKLKPVFSDHV